MSFKKRIEEGLEKIRTNRKIQIYIGAAVVAVIIVVGAIVATNHYSKPDTPTVQTYTIPENEKIFINGIVIPKESKQIMGPTNGVIPDIRVSNGQKVNKGDILYIIKDEAALSEVSSIKSQINTLVKQKHALKPDDPNLIMINSQISSLNSSLSAANAKAYIKVTAPIAGRVFLNNTGNTANQNPSGSLMTLQTTDYIMNGLVSEQDLPKIRQDMTATITVLPTGDTLKGRINYISDRPVSATGAEANEKTMSYYNVNLSFDSQDGIVDGYHLQAAIEVNTDKHKVPNKSIVKEDGEVYVLAEVDGVLEKVNVEVITSNKDYSIVTGDLIENEIIVKNPNKNMKSGDPIPGSSVDDEKK